MSFTNRNQDEQMEMLKEIINDSESFIYILDINTYELLYVNEKMEQLTGKPTNESIGKTCYDYIKNRTCPCESCFINSTGSDKYCVKEYVGEKTGKIYQARGKIINWFGRKAMIEYLKDETKRLNKQKDINNLINNIPGGIGIFNYYDDGELEIVYLNDGYYSMIGTTREKREIFSGFSVLNAINSDDLSKVKKTVKECVANNKKINIDIRILTSNGKYKWFNVKGSISFKEKDKAVIYVFYSDIDELKTAHNRLQTGREAICLASKSQELSFWIYYIDEKISKFSYYDESPLGYKNIRVNVPDSLYGTGIIHAEDEDNFKKFYEQLFNGVEKPECIVRILNQKTKLYEWQHLVYTRVDEGLYGKNVAIGFSANANREQENSQKYNNELALRKRIIKNSLFYYQLNLSTGILEEYENSINDDLNLKVGSKIDEETKKEILAKVIDSDKEKVNNTLFSNALIKMYNKGKVSIDLSYRRYIPNYGIKWVKTFVNILEKPLTNDVIAFIYAEDIDKEKKQQLVINKAITKEIESIITINVVTKQSIMKIINKNSINTSEETIFDYDADALKIIFPNINNEDFDSYKTFLKLENIIEILKKENAPIFTYKVVDNKGNSLRKKIRMFYLDETKNEIVFVIRDITDLYKEEQRQKRILQEAKDKAVEANKAKTDFLSRISHDIRTPLTSILALSSQEMMQNVTNKQMLEYFEKINISGKYLLNLVNDVLDMSKIESKKLILHYDVYKFAEFENTINTIIVDQCKKKNIDFEFKIFDGNKDNIITDKVRFDQIMINLLSNAVKFTPEGGKIEFIIECLGVENGKIKERYIVKDNGIGMSEEFLPHCFDIFSQENESKHITTEQGTGLGLAIVKQIVELMNGKIFVESKKNQGTTFIIELSLELASKNLSIQKEYIDNLNEKALIGLKILLCEDNKINSEIITYILNKKGCIVTSCENGQLGYEKFKDSPTNYFDVVLMDIRMPVMNGIEATKAIRKLDRTDSKNIPIIALTADAFNEDYIISKDAGMTAHLTKPIDTKLMFSTIVNYLKK